jgi:hypothetical protein
VPEYTLEITLENETNFSLGAGVSGIVDSDMQQDELGLPTISGRALKGLLVNVCSEILYALDYPPVWEETALHLFGARGELEDEADGLFIGDATLAPDLVAHLHHQALPREDILAALTDIRRQTAMNEYGAPEDESLRAVRVVRRGLTFYAPLFFPTDPGEQERGLLAACVKGLRRAGLGRTRGKGKLKAAITARPLVPQAFASSPSDELTSTWFEFFKNKVTPEVRA